MVTTAPSPADLADRSVTRLPHQVERFTHLKSRTRLCLLLDAGLGKTAMLLAYIDQMLRESKRRRVLVVVPGIALQQQWSDEHQKHAPWLRVHFAGIGRNSPCPAAELANFDIEVTSPELLKSCLHGYLAKRFDVVVVDELGEFRSGGKEWQALTRICDEATHVWAGSATLVQNYPPEVWHSLRVIAGPDLMPLHRFNEQFTAITAGRYNRWTKRLEPAKPEWL